MEIALSKFALVVISSTAFPDSMWKKIKNVGALSKIEDNKPLTQKHFAATTSPLGAIHENIALNGPLFP